MISNLTSLVQTWFNDSELYGNPVNTPSQGTVQASNHLLAPFVYPKNDATTFEDAFYESIRSNHPQNIATHDQSSDLHFALVGTQDNSEPDSLISIWEKNKILLSYQNAPQLFNLKPSSQSFRDQLESSLSELFDPTSLAISLVFFESMLLCYEYLDDQFGSPLVEFTASETKIKYWAGMQKAIELASVTFALISLKTTILSNLKGPIAFRVLMHSCVQYYAVASAFLLISEILSYISDPKSYTRDYNIYWHINTKQ